MTRKFHKETFDNISEEKRSRILRVATGEFAAKGFGSTNINTIASKAGISVGSVYRYFASKEDLFLTLAEQFYADLDEALWPIITDEGDIFEKMERIIVMAREHARGNPEITQLYLDCTTEGLSEISRELSSKIEGISAQYYRSLIATAKTKGLVADDVDEAVAAFCVDSLFLVTQFSYSASYFKERMKVYISEDILDDDERVIKGMAQFIRRALAAPEA